MFVFNRGGGGVADFRNLPVELVCDVDPADCGTDIADGATLAIGSFTEKINGLTFVRHDPSFMSMPVLYGRDATAVFGGEPALLFPESASWIAMRAPSCLPAGYSGGYTIAGVFYLAASATTNPRGLAGVSRYDAPGEGFGVNAALNDSVGPYHYNEAHHDGQTGTTAGTGTEGEAKVLIATRDASGELVEQNGPEVNRYGTSGYNAMANTNYTCIGAASYGRSGAHLRGFLGRLLIFKGDMDTNTRKDVGSTLADMYGGIPETWAGTVLTGGGGPQLVRSVRRG